MLDSLQASLTVASSGLEAQSTRMRIVSENLANATATGRTPAPIPISARRSPSMPRWTAPRARSWRRSRRSGVDTTPFRVEYEPGHPAADKAGYVKLPNVNMMIEMADMREVNRSYEANLQVVKQVRSMLGMTIDLLRS